MKLGLLALALSAPPLMPVLDLAEPGVVAWWREGELLVGVPGREGRPGLRPLVDLSPITLPEDLTAFELLGADCAEGPVSSAAATIDGHPVRLEVTSAEGAPILRLLGQDDRVLATNTLGRPARICALRLVQADALPGLEAIVSWRTGEATAEVAGLSVFRIPETAR